MVAQPAPRRPGAEPDRYAEAPHRPPESAAGAVSAQRGYGSVRTRQSGSPTDWLCRKTFRGSYFFFTAWSFG